MRSSDWSSDVCSSDLGLVAGFAVIPEVAVGLPPGHLRAAARAAAGGRESDGAITRDELRLAPSGFSHLERHAAGGDVGGHALLHDPPTQGSDAQQGQDKQHTHHAEQRRALLLPVAWSVDEWRGFHLISWWFRSRM